MAEHWIDASKALEIVGDEYSICTRLHAGLITARARTLTSDESSKQDTSVPASFWWAEGREALEQDWVRGDFSTWIDSVTQVFALGVMFPLSQILEMVAFEQRAIIARQISVAGSADWLPAKEARRLAYEHYGRYPQSAADGIMELARLGFIGARAVLAQGEYSVRTNDRFTWEEREWNVPTWFWTDFSAHGRASQDWELGRFEGSGSAPDKTRKVVLSGVHFHRGSLAALGPASAPVEAPAARGGRKPKYDWPAAINACWGRIYRGEPPVESQADIEQLLIEILTVRDVEPGESTVRPYASAIWAQYSKP
jgi:hypothetical protein